MLERKLKYKAIEMTKKLPVITIIGPRQSGKTTLVRSIFNNYSYISMEDMDNREFATNDPRGFLTKYSNHAIFDEVQKTPTLLSYIQTKVDENPIKGNFILTGSQNLLLLENVSQTLAGRTAILTLLPPSINELVQANYDLNLYDTIFNGFYPRPLVDKIAPLDWYPNYIQTYLERDVRQIKNIHDLSTFQKFIKMCAGRIGQLLNLSSLANDCGITHNTAKAWFSLLEASYITFPLSPHHQNFGKRLIKSPKLYFYDTGLACSLLGIENTNQLNTHYLRGALFENMVIADLIKNRFNKGRLPNLYYWRDKIGHEIDCIIDNAGQLTALECKSGQTVTQDFFLNLNYWREISKSTSEKLFVVYGGDVDQPRTYGNVISWKNLLRFTNNSDDN